MNARTAELALAFLVLVNSTAFLFTKLGMSGSSPMNVIAFRMLIAFAVLAPFLFKRIRKASKATVGVAVILGVLMFASMAFQAYGLYTVTTSEAGFLASTTVVFVPLIMAVAGRKLPKRSIAVGALFTLVGVGLISCAGGLGAHGLRITPGVILYLLGAFAYAVHVIVVGCFGQKVDLLAAGVIELFFTGIIALCASCAFGGPCLPTNSTSLAAMLALGMFTTAVGMGFQPMVQQFTAPERYGILFGLTPVFSMVLGVVFLGESLAPLAVAGGVLVLAGVMISEAGGRIRSAWKRSMLPALLRVLG